MDLKVKSTGQEVWVVLTERKGATFLEGVYLHKEDAFKVMLNYMISPTCPFDITPERKLEAIERIIRTYFADDTLALFGDMDFVYADLRDISTLGE